MQQYAGACIVHYSINGTIVTKIPDMQLRLLFAVLATTSAGFFGGSNFEKFKDKLVESQESLLNKDGSIKDDAFDLWKPEELHEWLSYHSIDSPGSDNTGALVAKARANKDKLLADLKDLYDNPPPSEKILTKGAEYFEQSKESLLNAWSDSALANFLAARGEDVSSITDHAALVALAEKSKSKAASAKETVSRWWLDNWDTEELKKTLSDFGANVEGNRQKLADTLWSEYEKAKDSAAKGQKEGYKQSQEAIKAIEKWRDEHFENWSLDDLKEYVGQFGPSQPTKQEQLSQLAKEKWNYFVYGEQHPKSWNTFLSGAWSHYGRTLCSVAQAGQRHLNNLLKGKEELYIPTTAPRAQFNAYLGLTEKFQSQKSLDPTNHKMAGRPWYIQAMDATHRLTVLGILGFSGYLGFLTVRAVQHNYLRREHKKLVEADPEPKSSS